MSDKIKLSKSRNIDLSNKIKEYEEFFNFKIIPEKDQAIITLFVYENLTDELLSMVKCFVRSHSKFNSKSQIFIFTNFVAELSLINNDKNVKFLFFPYNKKQFNTQRVLFNVCAIKKFFIFKKVFLLDTDIIALEQYSKLKAFESGYDIGLTFHNKWLTKKEFPINGGFLNCNNINLNWDNLLNFSKEYLNSYTKTIKFQDELVNKNIIEHDKYDLAEWMGDQYLYLLLFPTQLNTKIKIFEDFRHIQINFRLFNDRFFNFAPMELKEENLDINLEELFHKKLPYTFFLHLKGRRKKFINKILSII